MFEMYYARLIGVAHCIVPQLLPLPADPQNPLINAPSMELLASIMTPNQQISLGGNQMPSIVQIIVPAHSLQHMPIIEHDNHTDGVSTTTTAPEPLTDDVYNETISTPQSIETSSTVEPLRSSIPVTTSSSTSTTESEPEPEPEKEDDIEIQFNEDSDINEDYQENDEKVKKQRDRSDFRYVESFESEKSILQKFDPDPIDNETELKNVINENFQQIPSVLPVPKALSSSKDPENEDHDPPEVIQDQNAPEM